MFGALWKKSGTQDEEQANHFARQLWQLIEYFPVGDKVNYYPEYQQDICFETIVLGYELNGQSLFERDHVQGDAAASLQFYLEDSGDTVAATSLPDFAIIVPDTSELEKTLDYFSKAAIGRAGQFVRGNSITLLSKHTRDGTPSIDTSVDRRSLIKRGFYQGYKVVSLQPRLDTLTVVDHREQVRLELSLPGMLFADPDSEVGLNCTLIDASQHCVGLQCGDKSHLQSLADQVRVCIPMPTLNRSFDLTGDVRDRRDDGTVIVELHGLHKDGAMQPMQLVDRLDFRACLVQCSRDKRASGNDDHYIDMAC